MKITAYFDSGTTNSRIFILDGEQVLYTEKIAVGSKDSAAAKDRSVLTRALYALYTHACRVCGITDAQVREIYLSGMVTSPWGLCEVEHLPLPVNLQVLKENLYAYEEPACFHRTLYLVPGLKTIGRGIKTDCRQAGTVHNVRGEELELLGILQQHALADCAVLLPGSHTQTALVRDGTVVDLLSCVTGELYAAIVKDTIIGSGVENAPPIAEFVRLGGQAALQQGFNRALYIVRSMELFSDSTPAQRKSFLEGVVNVGVFTALKEKLRDNAFVKTAAVYGSRQDYDVLSSLCALVLPHIAVCWVPRQEDCPMSVQGMLALLHTADASKDPGSTEANI